MTQLEDWTGGRDAILAALAADEQIIRRKMTAPAQVLKLAATIAEQRATAHLAGMMRDKLQETLDTHVMMNGEFEDCEAEQRDDWTQGLDDQIESLFEEWQGVLSTNFLGTATDGQMHETAELERLASGFAREVWKQTTFDPETKKAKSAAKILSAAGVVEADVMHLLATVKPAPAPTPSTIHAALAPIREFIEFTGGIDGLEMELDLASDEDDILALPAMERIGGRPEDVPALREMRATWDAIGPGKGVEQMMRLLSEPAPAEEPAPTEEPPMPDESMAELMGITVEEYRELYKGKHEEPAAPAEKPKRGGRTKKDPAEDTTNAINEAMALISDNAKVKDDEVADAIGVSRATYNNWRNGKQPASLDEAQANSLRALVRSKLDGLTKALEILDIVS